MRRMFGKIQTKFLSSGNSNTNQIPDVDQSNSQLSGAIQACFPGGNYESLCNIGKIFEHVTCKFINSDKVSYTKL